MKTNTQTHLNLMAALTALGLVALFVQSLSAQTITDNFADPANLGNTLEMPIVSNASKRDASGLKVQTFYQLSRDFNITNFDAQLCEHLQKTVTQLKGGETLVQIVDKIFVEYGHPIADSAQNSPLRQSSASRVVYTKTKDRTRVLVAIPTGHRVAELDEVRRWFRRIDIAAILLEKAEVLTNGPVAVDLVRLDLISNLQCNNILNDVLYNTSWGLEENFGVPSANTRYGFFEPGLGDFPKGVGVSHQDVLRRRVAQIQGRRVENVFDAFFTSPAVPSSQIVLARAAVEAPDLNARKNALGQITNQVVLTAVALVTDNHDFLRSIEMRLTDQEALGVVVVQSASTSMRLAALKKLADQALLAKVALEDEDQKNRIAAVDRITDPVVLARVYVNSDESEIRGAAVAAFEGMISNRVCLPHLAAAAPFVRLRQAAVERIEDDDFLLRRAGEDSSVTVRQTAVDSLKHPDSLLAAASKAYYKDVREAARKRLDSLNLRSLVNKVTTAQSQIDRQVKAVGSAPESGLAETALNGEFDVVRQAAAVRLTDQAALNRLVLEATDREVVKISFSKLNDAALLAGIADCDGANRAVRLAASHKIGRQSWETTFREAVGNPIALGDALAAVSLFATVQSAAQRAVEETCLALIERSDESRIPEMTDLLEGYGNKQLVEDYLNSGQADLERAAKHWAFKRGFNITSGNGSARARWRR